MNLHQKIERGEFIDLEKLMPRGGVNTYCDDGKIELVNRDGATFFAPVQNKETKITNICKWEQAFRVYAAIYTHANPERAFEIWQYVYVINTAALSYSWDNVAFYDTTFRQLMAFKPWRSWAKTYVQGWNLAMKDPLSKSGVGSITSGSRVSGTDNQQRDWCDDCCWKFNRNKCNRPNCPWDHRCTYWGGWGHSFLDCRKCQKKHGSKRHSHSPAYSSKKDKEKGGHSSGHGRDSAK